MGLQQHWDTSPGANQTADPQINQREGMAPSQVNDAARQIMAMVAAWAIDIAGGLVTTGTSTAYALTSAEPFTALVEATMLAFRPHVSSGAAPTLNVNGIGAVPLVSAPGVAAALTQDRIIRVTYRAAGPEWLVHGSGGVLDAPTGTRMSFQQTAAPLGWVKEAGAAFDNAAMRLVTGSVVNGGTAGFTTAFAARTIAITNLPAGTIGTAQSAGSHSHSGSADAVGNHSHTIAGGTAAFLASGSNGIYETAGADATAQFVGQTDSAGAHGHSLSIDAGGAHTHSVASAGSGTALDFNVKFIDHIVAQKA